jgi:tetratricopeptide (TPR) repeat protein
VADARFLIGPQNALTVAKICQRLDGIPLAIELAAARVNMLTVEKISQRLDDRFNLLTNGLRSALPRHRTLRAAIEWSYDLLSEKEQILFRRLAVFVGGWTLDAVEEVCSGDGIEAGEILDLLAQLVNKSLVLVDPRSEESRYRRLETIRQFAYGKFLESGENDYLRRKHYSYFLDLAEQVDRETDRPSKHKLKERLEADNDNFRAALEWCILEKNTEFALRLLRGWAINGRLPFGEIQNWFDRVLTLPNVSAYSEIYAKLLNFIGVNSWSQNKFDYAKSIMVESQMIWQKLGEEGELGLAQSLRILGEIAATSEEGRSIAQSFLEKSLELYQKHGNEWAVGQVIFSLGHKAMWEGRYEEATENFKKALEIWKKIDAILGMAVASNELGELARLQGDFVRAGEFYGQSLGARRKQGNRTDLAGSLSNYAWATLRNGDYHYAKELFKESLELCIIDRNMFLIMLGLAGLAGFLEMSGKHEEAAQLFGASECLYKSSGGGLRDPADQNDIDYYLAMVREQLDEATFAKAWSEGSHMTLEQAVAFARTKTSL